MFNSKNKTTISIIASLIFILTIALVSLTKRGSEGNKSQAFPEKPFEKVSNTRNYWKGRIEEVGSEAAYQEFKKKYEGDGFANQHGVAHIIGELLYEKNGLDGLGICDSTFAFGCYHSFFGRALAELGPKIIPELNDTCVKKFGPLGTGCQHGIGHGILEFMTTARLVDALNACTLTTQVRELFGCTSGVFMEYNSPITTNADGSFALKTREFNPSNPDEPCNTIVPDRFKKSCYYEINQWRIQILNHDYKKIGILCSEVENKTFKESCYLGFGNVAAPSSNYDPKKTIAMCEEMPDDEGELFCRTGASWSFYASPPHRTLAPQACEGLSLEDKSYCINNSDLIGERKFNEELKK